MISDEQEQSVVISTADSDSDNKVVKSQSQCQIQDAPKTQQKEAIEQVMKIVKMTSGKPAVEPDSEKAEIHLSSGRFCVQRASGKKLQPFVGLRSQEEVTLAVAQILKQADWINGNVNFNQDQPTNRVEAFGTMTMCEGKSTIPMLVLQHVHTTTDPDSSTVFGALFSLSFKAANGQYGFSSDLIGELELDSSALFLSKMRGVIGGALRDATLPGELNRIADCLGEIGDTYTAANQRVSEEATMFGQYLRKMLYWTMLFFCFSRLALTINCVTGIINDIAPPDVISLPCPACPAVVLPPCPACPALVLPPYPESPAVSGSTTNCITNHYYYTQEKMTQSEMTRLREAEVTTARIAEGTFESEKAS